MRELPQNLKVVLQEVGESSALLILSMLLIEQGIQGWRVFRSYTEGGCDLLLLGSGREIKLEVKSRQSFLVSKNQHTQVQFTVTNKERNSSDFLLAYWLDKGRFFVVPTSDLAETSSRGTPVFKFTARYSKNEEEYTDACRPYLEDWERILELVR